MFINGSLALYEDARPGGFDNPGGSITPPFARGMGSGWYWNGGERSLDALISLRAWAWIMVVSRAACPADPSDQVSVGAPEECLLEEMVKVSLKAPHG